MQRVTNSGLSRLIAPLAAVGMLLGAALPANAATLSLEFSDQALDGDNIDLIALAMNFDDVSGDYSIVIRTTDALPFVGDFRLNVHLFNPDTGTTESYRSMFSDTFNDYSLGSATQTEIELTGTNPALAYWEAGHRVAITGPTPLGLPSDATYTSFQSHVLEGTTHPFYGVDRFDSAYAVIAAPVPLPASLPLFAFSLFGLGAFASIRRRFTSA